LPGREHSRLRADRRSAPSPSLEIIRSDSLGSDRARVGGAESSIVAGSEAKVSEAEDHAGDEGGDVESDKGHRKQMMEILTTDPYLARQLSVFVTGNTYGMGRQTYCTMVTQDKRFIQVQALRRGNTLRPVGRSVLPRAWLERSLAGLSRR
jgi:hypothetical protein